MTQLSVSRRKVLAGLGMIGIASAGAGLGTTAYFRDEESVAAELQAGRLDLLIDYRATYTSGLDQNETDAVVDGPALPVPDATGMYVVGQAPDWRDEAGDVLSGTAWADLTNSVDACTFEDTTDIRAEAAVAELPAVDGTPDVADSFFPGYVDGAEGVMFDLNDVKPKDVGEATISVHLCDNPAFVGLTAEVTEALENGVVEPENVGEFVDDGEASELPFYVYVRAWLDTDCSNTYEAESETLVYQGSLAGLVEAISEAEAENGVVEGLPISEDCLTPGVHCVAFDWEFVCEPEDFERPSDAVAEGTLGDELDAAGLPLDPNAAQTDTVNFRIGFEAVQCRHQGGGPAFRKVEGEGFGKNDAGADGLVEPVPLEGKIREGGSGFTVALNGENATENIDNGVAVPFTLSYDGTTATLLYEDPDGDVTLSDDVSLTDAVGVTVRARGTDNYATVSNLRLEVPSSGVDTTVGGTLDPRDNAGFPGDDDQPERYCAFLDVDGLADGFTLSGDATLTYDPATASDEQPAVYFFAGATGAV
jgi:predicted ribosomally synthesized peptide with SipW-like signal peptide